VFESGGVPTKILSNSSQFCFKKAKPFNNYEHYYQCSEIVKLTKKVNFIQNFFIGLIPFREAACPAVSV
jgi:hypothetical protein